MKRVSIFFMGIVTICCITIFSSSCVNNKKDVLFACDSTNVSFSKNIKPILVNNCNSCHSTLNAPNNGAGIALETYTDIINSGYVDDSTTLANGGDGGKFVTDVQSGKMPKSASKLSDCDATKIKNWVFEGSKDN